MSKTPYITFLELLFLKSCVWYWRAFSEHCPLYQVVLWCSFFFLLLTWVACGGGHHYWIIFRHEAWWPPKRSFIYFGPLSNFPKEHHVGPKLYLSIPSGRYPHCGAYEWNYMCLWPPFDPISLSWARVNVSKCKFWSPSGIFLGIKILQGDCILVTYGLHILGVPWVFRTCHTFFGWGFILGRGTYRWSFFFGRCPCCFGHFDLMCSSPTFLFHMGNTSFFLPIFFGGFFDRKIMQVCGDIVGLGAWESFQGPLVRCQVQLLISFGGINLISMENCPFCFSRVLGSNDSVFVL
jgi:hypothetical protein